MEHEFYRSGFGSGLRGVPSLFAWLVVLLFSFSQCCSQEPVENEKSAVHESNACLATSGFEEIKSEVGYRDPQRYSKGEPETLIRWILVGSGVWCLIVIFLFALFHRSSVDLNWVKEQSEQED